jgi:hypothetical protein
MRLRFVASIILAASLLPLEDCDQICGNKVMGESLSPDGSHRAVFFERGCGSSANLSVLGAKEQLPNSAGNTLVADYSGDLLHTAIRVTFRWQDSSTLAIGYSDNARVSRRSENIDGVKISYARISTPR